MCPATAKLAKRRTAKMVVKPMAGSARTAPAMTPLAKSWRILSITSRFDHDDLAVADLIQAEFDFDDVAVLVESARAGGTLVVDLLAIGDRLHPVGRIVDLDARIIGDLPYGIADRGSARLTRLGHRQDREVHVVVGLADVCVELVALEHRLQAGVSSGSGGGDGLDAVNTFGGFLPRTIYELRRQTVSEAYGRALVV